MDRLRGVAPYAGLLLAFTIFSAYTVIMKRALNDGGNPVVLAFLREVVATAVLLPSAWWSQRRKPVASRRFLPEEADLFRFFVLGACMVYAVQLLSALSLEHITASNYALLAPSVPVITLALALVLGHEHFNRRSALSWAKVAAILVTAAGALYISAAAFVGSKPATSADGVYRNPLLGNLMLLVNKVCVALYPIQEKVLLRKYDPSVIVAWAYVAGAVLVGTAVIPCALTPEAWAHVVTPSAIQSILFSGLLSSAFNYTLLCYVNKHVGPVTVMAFYPWQSICTPLLAWLILGNSVKTADVVGGLIIIAGLGLCVLVRWKERAAAAAAGGGHVPLEEVVGGNEAGGVGGDDSKGSSGGVSGDECVSSDGAVAAAAVGADATTTAKLLLSHAASAEDVSIELGASSHAGALPTMRRRVSPHSVDAGGGQGDSAPATTAGTALLHPSAVVAPTPSPGH